MDSSGVRSRRSSAAGEIWTLCATDLCTGWTERMAVMGKGQTGIVAALEHIQRQLPFPLLGLHTDNGSEFIKSTWKGRRRGRPNEHRRLLEGPKLAPSRATSLWRPTPWMSVSDSWDWMSARRPFRSRWRTPTGR